MRLVTVGGVPCAVNCDELLDAGVPYPEVRDANLLKLFK